MSKSKPIQMTIFLPRCPVCQSTALKSVRSVNDLFGRRRYSRCRGCGQRLTIWVR